MIRIITDSTADLGAELADAHRIQVVPLLVHMGGQTYRDGVDLGAADVFRLVEAHGELPKTAAPSLANFMAAFDGPDECLYIGISAQLSGSVNNARLAAAELPPGKVRIVDSLNLSTGIGLLALLAADLRDQGLAAAQIEAAVRAAVPKVHTSFVIETLRYLYMGGRCSAMQNLVGSVLKIRPVIEVLGDGALGVRERVRGTRKRALQTMLDDYAAHLPELDRRRVFVTHSGCVADAEYLRDEIMRIGVPGQVLITQAGCVVSSHCGPDTIGILYLTR